MGQEDLTHTVPLSPITERQTQVLNVEESNNTVKQTEQNLEVHMLQESNKKIGKEYDEIRQTEKHNFVKETEVHPSPYKERRRRKKEILKENKKSVEERKKSD